nr:peptidoglycan DD-metalloendopeptidase family protein [Actinomycetota bacterium]
MAYRNGLVRRPALAAAALSMLLALMAAILPAGAASKDDVEDAKARVDRLASGIGSASDRLAALEANAERLAGEIFEAENGLAAAEAELAAINEDLSAASRRLDRLQGRLNDQAATQYMQGAARSVDLLLGSESFNEFSDRLEYVNAVSQQTADLTSGVQKLRSELEWRQERQIQLRDRQRLLVGQLEDKQEQLFDQLADQEALIEEIVKKKADAADEARSLGREYQKQLRQQLAEQEHQHTPPATVAGGSVSGANPLLVCPVGQPRGYSDGFGAPRYGGGYHPHGGVDIIAPQGTPIYATFPGTVRDASNGLGGISVTVTGSHGWTYNAHLVSIARLGSVNTGDVIGYVGATGDTSTPHNHFEWHPNVIPGNWPESAYGYSVAGSAINPYPLLTQVC